MSAPHLHHSGEKLVSQFERGRKGKKGQKGSKKVKTKVRDNALSFMALYDPSAPWYPTMKCHNVTMSHCHKVCVL